MKRRSSIKLLWLALTCAVVLALGAYGVDAYYLRTYGRIVASRTTEIGTISIRERCCSDFLHFIVLDRILRDRLSEYEYWIELHRDGQLISVSDHLSWDSTSYDNPRIDGADTSGATVSLNPRPPYPSVHHFDWLPAHLADRPQTRRP